MPHDEIDRYSAFPMEPQIGLHDVHVVRLQLERTGDWPRIQLSLTVTNGSAPTE